MDSPLNTNKKTRSVRKLIGSPEADNRYKKFDKALCVRLFKSPPRQESKSHVNVKNSSTSGQLGEELVKNCFYKIIYNLKLTQKNESITNTYISYVLFKI